MSKEYQIWWIWFSRGKKIWVSKFERRKAVFEYWDKRVFSRFCIEISVTIFTFFNNCNMLRNLLFSIFLNRRARKQYNTYKRKRICEAVTSEVIFYRIQKNYEVSEFFIRSIVFNVLICHNLDFKPRSEKLKSS